MNKNDKILVAGSAGMVGSAIMRNLIRNGFTNLVGTYFRNVPEKHEHVRYRRVDFLDPQATAYLFTEEEPDIVFYAAAKVGGIVANNTYRAQFLYDNLRYKTTSSTHLT